MTFEIKKAAITGASSGIGHALAHELARQGASLALLARSEDRLQQLASELRQRYPQQTFVVQPLDVAQLEQIAPAIRSVAAQLGGLDTVIVNAGVANVHATGKGDFDRELKMLRINLLGAMATCDAAAALFRQNDAPSAIVGIASVAGIQGIPGSAGYSASKAGFAHYLNTIALELGKFKVQVTTVYPGFIRTELAPNMDRMPFVIEADVAASSIIKAVRKGKRKLVVPAWPWKPLLPLLKLLPPSVIVKAMR